MRRGEVWEAELRPRSGSEQSGRRPVLVISNDGFNEISTWRSVVVPCSTSDKQRARGPSAVPLKKGAGGLRKGSVVLCHQITTLDRESSQVAGAPSMPTRWRPSSGGSAPRSISDELEENDVLRSRRHAPATFSA